MQIIVLGMHRSGTSIVTRLLNMMGAYLGPEDAIKGASHENLKGFWERDDFLDINKAILKVLGCSWPRVANFDIQMLDGIADAIIEKEARNVLVKLESHRPWAVKDPRMCLVLPYWRRLLEVPVCVHIHRNPLQVAQSLQKRNGFAIPVGIALWERYNLCALTGSQGLPRIFIRHDDLVANPVSVTKNLYKELVDHGVRGLTLPSDLEISSFVDKDLHRERGTEKRLEEFLNNPQKRLLKAFKAGTAGDLSPVPQLSAGAMETLKDFEANLDQLEKSRELENQIKEDENRHKKSLEEAAKRSQQIEEDREMEWTDKRLRREMELLETKVADRESQLLSQELGLARIDLKLSAREEVITDLRATNSRLNRYKEDLQGALNESERRTDKIKEDLQQQLARAKEEAAAKANAFREKVGNLQRGLDAATQRASELERNASREKQIEKQPVQHPSRQENPRHTDRPRNNLEIEAENKLLRESVETLYGLIQHNEQHRYWRIGLACRRLVGVFRPDSRKAPYAFRCAIEVIQQVRSTGNQGESPSTDDEIAAENKLLRESVDTLYGLIQHNERHWYWRLGQKFRRLVGVFRPDSRKAPYALRRATEIMQEVRGHTPRKGDSNDIKDAPGFEDAVKIVRGSGLFDSIYYAEHNIDVVKSDKLPLRHYMRDGWREGRNPSSRFDSQYYIEKDPGLVRRPENPLLHYVTKGKAEGREIFPAVLSRVSTPNAIKRFCVPADVTECRELQRSPNPGSVAVVIDLYCDEMASELADYLLNIPVSFDLYVTTNAQAREGLVDFFTEKFPKSRLEVRAVPDVGSDVASFLIEYGEICGQYDLVCKIHSRKVMRYLKQRPDDSHSLKNLLGSKELIATLFDIFQADTSVGLIHPKTSTARREYFYNNSFWGSSRELATDLAKRLKLSLPEEPEKALESWTGRMFWFRPAALGSLLSLKLDYDDFGAAHLCDGTSAHAIERMYGIVASKEGFTQKSVFVYAPDPTPDKGPYKPLADDTLRDRIVEYKSKDRTRNRIVIYTAISGGYDTLKIPEYMNPEYDYVCFSDRPIEGDIPWEIRPIDYFHTDSTRIARYYKTHAHLYLKEYEIAVWIDANILIRADIQFLIDRFLASDMPIASNPHPTRSCIYTEADICRILEKDAPDEIVAQTERYEEEGFPRNLGMAETNVLIFRPNDPLLRRVFIDWWRELDNGSRRDQMSFTYALFKNQSTFALLADNPDLIPRYDREHFELFLHGGETSWEYPLPYQVPGFLRDAYQNSKSPYWETQNGAGKLEDMDLWPYRDCSVDVVIPIYNALEDVKRCLDSVDRTLLNSHHLILVDDGSDEQTKSYLEEFAADRPYVTLIRHEQPQLYTKAANAGIRASTADFVILLNSDTIVPGNWITKLIHCAESMEDIGIVGPMSNAASWQSAPFVKSGRAYAVNPLPPSATVDDIDELFEEFSLHPIFPKVSVLNGFCFCIKREVITKIGLFDEEAFPRGYGEENDFCFRATDAGFLLAIATHTYVFHAKSKSYTSKRRLELAKASGKVFTDRYGEARIGRATQSLAANPILARTREAFLERLKQSHPRSLWTMQDMSETNVRVVRDISLLKKEGTREWKMTATGPSPCFELTNLPFEAGQFYAISLEMSGPEPSVSVYYNDIENGNDYSDAQSVLSRSANGQGMHVLAIPCDTLAPYLRIAPGSLQGDYVLRSLEIRNLDL